MIDGVHLCGHREKKHHIACSSLPAGRDATSPRSAGKALSGEALLRRQWQWCCSGSVAPPSTSYNGIGAGFCTASGTWGATGPTLDNGRAKPDICAPIDASSFAAPLVSGAATLLIQAARRGVGGNTNDATDIRTLKALLLNGAIKPPGWSNPSPSPLDPRYGAGVLNVFNSYCQLAGGEQGFITNSSEPANSAHPPATATGDLAVLSGWDLDTISNASTNVDVVNHYCFEVTNSSCSGPFTATMTLVWNRQVDQSAINNLDLYLYRMDDGSLIGASTSTVDNVQHIYVPQLPPGRYDLQVLKQGGAYVTASETYALAFDFFTVPLSVTQTSSGLNFTWPLYPAGFELETNSTSGLLPGGWDTNNLVAPVISNNLNNVTLGFPLAPVFFRLVRVP